MWVLLSTVVSEVWIIVCQQKRDPYFSSFHTQLVYIGFIAGVVVYELDLFFSCPLILIGTII